MRWYRAIHITATTAVKALRRPVISLFFSLARPGNEITAGWSCPRAAEGDRTGTCQQRYIEGDAS